jgi:hypothetical protein
MWINAGFSILTTILGVINQYYSYSNCILDFIVTACTLSLNNTILCWRLTYRTSLTIPSASSVWKTSRILKVAATCFLINIHKYFISAVLTIVTSDQILGRYCNVQERKYTLKIVQTNICAWPAIFCTQWMNEWEHLCIPFIFCPYITGSINGTEEVLVMWQYW